jgi:hypothetical protein
LSKRPLQVAIVYPGDAEVRRLANRENNRFALLFAAFAAHGVDAHPAVYNRDQAGALREQLLGLDGALVWVNPIEAGHSRAPWMRSAARSLRSGHRHQHHPDVIMKLGTKDVLVDTREMGWGSDVHRLDTLEQLRRELGQRLAAGSTRVLKQWRGHSGLGVVRIQASPSAAAFGAKSHVLARHAQRGSPEISTTFDEFVASMAHLFRGRADIWSIRPGNPASPMEWFVATWCRTVSQATDCRRSTRCIRQPKRSRGGREAPMPGPRLYHPRTCRTCTG